MGVRQRTGLLWSAVCVAAVAGPAGAGEPPAVDVVDLPPLPEVSSEDDLLLDIAVEGASHVHEYVVVGASKREQSLGTVASAVTVIPGEQLRRLGYRQVADVLSGVVGFYMVDDRMMARVGVRGLSLLGDSNTRILILVDGTTINEPWSHYADVGAALPVHIDDIARIEIIRGPVSSIYGTNAFLGIINIVTREADRAPRVSARVGGGSFGTVTGNGSFGIGGVNRQVRGFVSWMARSGETLVFPEFAQDGSSTVTSADATDTIAAGVSLYHDELFAQLRVSHRYRQLPGAPYDSVPGDTGNVARDLLLLGEVGYARELGPVSVASRAYVSGYQNTSELQLEMEGTPAGAQPFESAARSLWLGAELRGLYPVLPEGRLDVTAGLAGEMVDTYSSSLLVNAPGETTEVSKSLNVVGIYSEVNWRPLSWVSTSAGARYDTNSLFAGRVSPRGALFLHKGKRYGLKLLYARGFRNPSILETFYDDGQRYRPSGGELRPETISSREVVAWASPRAGIDLRLSTWQWDLQDLIEKRSVYDPVLLTPRFQFQNLAVLQSRGAELECTYRDARGWLVRLAGAYAKVERNEGFEDPINAPEFVVNAAMSSPLVHNRVHLSTELNYVGARRTRAEEKMVRQWLGWNAVVYLPNYQGFDAVVGVRNILGNREQVPAQTDYDRVRDDRGALRGIDMLAIPGSGRELFVRVGYSY